MEPSDSQFAELGAHPSLVSTLTAREYLTATPVQAAVLGSPDHDLLVTAQTGSGKTVAFGLLIGQALLGEANRVAKSSAPRALVIAPTRELAAQVQRELEWLLAETGARVASFTGGTDMRGDARALSRGVDVAVGTPGRLIDLVSRKSLDLSSLSIAVLDEADEMLDMGFREDIEALLAAAPASRRTLLFSATLPPEIRALAKKYQRDAIPVDARTTVVGAHDDITYTANLCANGERTRALVNLLRLADDERTLVFCRTRDDVGELHRELASRGFLAAAISGDRAQAERDRALETMRQGRVRVLVATNVAARGLDLPELSLVVHAALPENVEALTHRSGRTGRAGKKGRSLFLVEVGERRRAERLFHAAKLHIPFTAPPTLEDVARHERQALKTEVDEAMETAPADAAIQLADAMLADHDAQKLVAALLDRSLKTRPAGEKLTPVNLAGPPRKNEGPKRTDGGFVLFQVNMGAKDNAQVNWILPLVCKRGNVTRKDVGAIRIARDRTFVEIATAAADEFAANSAERDPRAPNVRIERAEGEMPPRTFTPGPRKPGFDKRPFGKPGFDRGGDRAERPGSYDKRSFDKPARTFDKPTGERPSYRKPGFDRPTGERPSYGNKSGFVKSGYGKGTPKGTRKP